MLTNHDLVKELEPLETDTQCDLILEINTQCDFMQVYIVSGIAVTKIQVHGLSACCSLQRKGCI